MLHTTFAKAKEFGACESSYRKMAKLLGGVTKYGKDTPIPLDTVLEVCGLDDTLWALRCTVEPSNNLIIEIACQYKEHVLHIFEEMYPNDKRPRLAIEAARLCLTDNSAAARDAAWDAAASDAAARDTSASDAAAGEAAWYARYAVRYAAARYESAFAWDATDWYTSASDAASDAEKEWQEKALIKLIKGGE